MRNFFKQALAAVNNNGPILGVILISWRVKRKVFSLLYAKILNAKKLDIGQSCRIKGLRYIKFGKNISIFNNAWIEAVYKHQSNNYSPIINIGDRVTMSNNVHISAINSISIESDVLIGSNIYISDHSHGIYSNTDHSHPSTPPAFRPLGSKGSIKIERNAWICDNVTIIGGLTIGEGSIIGANSVVTRSIPPFTIAVGAPATPIKIFCKKTMLWIKLDQDSQFN